MKALVYGTYTSLIAFWPEAFAGCETSTFPATFVSTFTRGRLLDNVFAQLEGSWQVCLHDAIRLHMLQHITHDPLKDFNYLGGRILISNSCPVSRYVMLGL